MHIAKKVEIKTRVHWTDAERDKIYAEMYRRGVDPNLRATEFIKEEKSAVSHLRIRERPLWPPEARKERVKYLEFIRSHEAGQKRAQLNLVVDKDRVMDFNVQRIQEGQLDRREASSVPEEILSYIDILDESVIPVKIATEPKLEQTPPLPVTAEDPAFKTLPELPLDALREELAKHRQETMALLVGMYDGIMAYFDKDYRRVEREPIKFVGIDCTEEVNEEIAQEFTKSLQEKQTTRYRVLYASGNYKRLLSLQNDFQGIDFDFVSTDQTRSVTDMAAKRDYDLVIAARWMSHGESKKLQEKYGERYVPSNGSLSDARRIISERFSVALINSN